MSGKSLQRGITTIGVDISKNTFHTLSGFPDSSVGGRLLFPTSGISVSTRQRESFTDRKIQR
jgi:hypothetical protein